MLNPSFTGPLTLRLIHSFAALTVELKAIYARPVELYPDGYFLLERNDFRLAITHERVELPKESKIAARVEGRSTLARLGLAVHMTAPTIHCGFAGNI